MNDETSLAEQLAHMIRPRDATLTVKEFGDELTDLFRIMFPSANEKAHYEMVLVGQALAVWLQLLIRSEVGRIRDGYH